MTDVHISPGSVRGRVEFILGADRLVSESNFRRSEIIVIVIDIERRLYSTLMIARTIVENRRRRIALEDIPQDRARLAIQGEAGKDKAYDL